MSASDVAFRERSWIQKVAHGGYETHLLGAWKQRDKRAIWRHRRPISGRHSAIAGSSSSTDSSGDTCAGHQWNKSPTPRCLSNQRVTDRHCHCSMILTVVCSSKAIAACRRSSVHYATGIRSRRLHSPNNVAPIDTRRYINPLYNHVVIIAVFVKDSVPVSTRSCCV